MTEHDLDDAVGLRLTRLLPGRPFEPDDDATRMTVVQTGFPPAEVRDLFTSAGWVGAFGRLEAYLRSAR